jgi:Tol biopolymer transport system component
MLHNLDSGAEQTLTTVDDPEFYNSAPSWSPDGKQIACVLTRPGGSIIALFDARTGSRRNFSDVKAAFFDGAQWLRDGSGLVVSGVDVSAGPAEQLFLLSYPGGRRQRITNDLMSYTSISVSGADEAVAAVRRTTLGNLWVADAAGGPARQLTHVATSESSPRTVSAGGSDLVVFDAGLEREIPLWSVPASGGEPHPLTTGPQYVITHFSASGVVVCERADHQAVRHLFRVDPQDGRTQQLTNGSGETMLDLSHDGKRVTFAKADSTRGVWTVATDGGAETLLSATALAGNGRFSPNGQGVLTFEYGHTADGLIRAEMVVLAAADGKPLQHINITPRADLIDWSPDSQSITYIDRGDSAWNVYRAGSAGAPARVTSFTTGRVTAYRWSPDGTRLAVARLIDGVTNLWVTDGAGEHATQLTQFPLGDILSLAWLPDSRRIVVNAGTLSRDVVLVRNFR